MNAIHPTPIVRDGYPLRQNPMRMGQSVHMMMQVLAAVRQAHLNLAPAGFVTSHAQIEQQLVDRYISECQRIWVGYLNRVDTIDNYNDKACVHFILALSLVQTLVSEIRGFLEFKEITQPGFSQAAWIPMGFLSTQAALDGMEAGIELDIARYRASIGTDNPVLQEEEEEEKGDRNPENGAGQGPAQAI